MESEDIEEIMGDPVWNVEDRDRGIMDLKFVYPFILVSWIVSPEPPDLEGDPAFDATLFRGKIFAIKKSSVAGENLAIALHIPSKTGTMHLQVDFLVLKGEGLSCFFISNSFIKMMFIKST